ncbi:carbohydrate ABC transporter permease [Paenibacillus sp. MMO-177]|uniref:carbohydrate ABC transporter permease n=1 Tax=Paenibacillus sp. MMO-177 TaxID=3081289 RepID=UPI00301765E6
MLFRSKRSFNDIGLTADLIINLIFIGIAVLCIIPLLLVISVSFTDENTLINEGYHFFPTQWSTAAYDYLFQDMSQILRSYGNSFLVTGVGTLIGLVIMALYAYPIARTDFPHQKFFSLFMFLTMLFNGGLVPWYMVYVKFLHLKDSYWALILPMLVGPFFVLILRTFFKGLPIELIESAKIDGASEFRIFRSVILPLSTPVLATVALFSTLGYWNDWFMSLVFITDDSKVSLQYLMYKTMLNIQYLSANTQAAQGIASGGTHIELPSESARMAMCIVGIGPIIFAYPFFQRYFVKGLTVGAVKG